MTATQWDNLPELIDGAGGFTQWTVGMLIRHSGNVKAGARIVEDIERELATRKIGHFPPSLPRDGARKVLLYNQDKPNLGAVLHIARQLATGEIPDGPLTDNTIGALDMLLKQYQRAVEEARKAARS
ncbi:hypothetical protein [Streptomyces sp. NPDC002619]|uniref:hypothetical protein n=1 Tax=Streptomyces sp. NPDC002619 TaxID=3364655 RepID=UPI003687BFDB